MKEILKLDLCGLVCVNYPFCVVFFPFHAYALHHSCCRNLPFGGRATHDSRVRFPNRCRNVPFAESPPTFICGKRRKNRKRRDLRTFKWKVRELYLRAGKVLAPHTSVTRDGRSLIECARTWLQYYFFLLFGVDKSMTLAPTYPQVWWGAQTYIVL